jgi:hypothetical protein
MADFLKLSPDDRREALNAAAANSGRPPHLLEKDIWVVWLLDVLFQAPFGQHLVFKGGTSLSKAFKIIRRFSEDVDITYDIRALAPDLTAESGEPFPRSPSQEKRWSKEIRRRLPLQINERIVPAILAALAAQHMEADLSAQDETLSIKYPALTTGTGYVRPEVLLEFGARSTGEPSEVRMITSDAASHLPGLAFPIASPRTMRPERTFWEKATAMHVYCAQGAFRGGNRFARHWHDITRLDASGFVDSAIRDRDLGLAVARHKAIFFREKGTDGALLNYDAAVSGQLRLIPQQEALKNLETDYARMVEDRLLPDDEADPFHRLLERCQVVQEKANNPQK